MKRLEIWTMLIVIVSLSFVTMGGCDSSDDNNNGGNCVKTLSTEFSELECASLANDYGCDSFTWVVNSADLTPPEGPCTLEFCQNCLCQNIDLLFATIDSVACFDERVLNSCLSAEFFPTRPLGDVNCELFECATELPCGPFN